MQNLQEKTFNLLEESGLNWTVAKQPLVTAEGNLPTDHFGLVRSNNQKVLGVVGKVYEPFQNFQMAEILLAAADGLGYDVSRGGMLRDGKKVYLQIGLPDEYIGKSDVRRMITGLNSHDGTRAIGFGSTDTVVVCENTFMMAYGQMMKFRHTMSAVEAIEEAMKGMRDALGLEAKKIAAYKKMSEITLKDDILASIFKACFEVDVHAPASAVPTVVKNKIIEVNRAIETEIKLEGPTLWGLFNGITRYTNHVAKTKDRDSYLMVGAGYDTNLVAFDTIMQWIEERTAQPVLVNA
jgi:phage/plasmid-like protein (TIGR03299 family)